MAFQDWKTEEFKKVDVRGIQGNFFPGLKKQAMGLPVGAGMEVIQSFDPIPLYEVMEGLGFEHHTEQKGDAEFHAYFYRKEMKQEEKECDMREKVGAVFSIAKENAPVPGCTVSKEISEGENYISVFSLAKDTDISAEIYPYHKLLIISDGGLTVYRTDGDKKLLSAGESIVTETDIPVGMRTDTGAVYTEIAIRREDIMNDAVKAGEVFKLVELVPYQEGKIVNMDVVHNDKMKFVVMAFDEGTGLSEHAAPGEALIFALDGEAVIGYEGEAHPIKAGENFHFAKGGMHSVKAEKKFKMALLLTLE